jgi:tetratricopeptide (TPR) repeat protein
MRSVAAIAAVLLSACAAKPVTPTPAELFNDALFAPPSERISAADIFAPSDAMRRYAHDELLMSRQGARQALIDAMAKDLRLEYDSARTRTAAEAFAARTGNCLSLVILTAALAKEVGLPVQYNRALISELWSRSGNLYLLNGHVNVTLGKRFRDSPGSYDSSAFLTVDFLPASDLKGLRTVPLEEATVVAMFMNNRAAEALVNSRPDDAYWWAREAVRADASFTGAYNTLGVVYVRRGQLGLAERVLRHLLAQQPENTLALANLALVLDRLGRAAEAAAVQQRLAGVEGAAPFHYFHRGLAAMQTGDFRAARALFARELDRDPDYHEFHFWLGLAELRLGNVDRARAQLALALENSTTRRDHDLYAAKLERLSLQLKH